jgi:GT2 family glycosyltransferase
MSNFSSIIIPVYNQLAYTKGCLSSLLADRDRPPYEVIIIDNGSSDGTREYLEEMMHVLKGTRDKLIPIINPENFGVAPAWNQGLQIAQGEYIGILNNDIVLTQSWFRSLLWAMEYHRLALVCPFAEGGELNYDLELRAKTFMQKNLLKVWPEYDFSAAILPHRTLDKIGNFDEKYLIGGYEDTDYCYRLKKAGYRYGISGAGFIHHYGSRTLGEFKKRGDKHAAHNLQYFMSKWNEDPSRHVGTLKSKIRKTWRKLKLHWDRM